jgi:hypothetical protein
MNEQARRSLKAFIDKLKAEEKVRLAVEDLAEVLQSQHRTSEPINRRVYHRLCSGPSDGLSRVWIC